MNRWCNLVAGSFLAMAAAALAGEASGTNYSDQWWVPSESGWGVSVQQQDRTLFVDLLIYGSGGGPRWYTAVASQGTSDAADRFSGDLYESRVAGEAGAFDPANVSLRIVGSLSFQAQDAHHALLSYSIDGSSVAKTVVRQTWRVENLTGFYAGAWTHGCNGDLGADTFWDLTVEQGPDNAITLSMATWASWGDRQYRIQGTYAQAGRLGTIVGQYVLPDVWGRVTITDIEVTRNGFLARIEPVPGCATGDRLVAVRRP